MARPSKTRSTQARQRASTVNKESKKSPKEHSLKRVLAHVFPFQGSLRSSSKIFFQVLHFVSGKLRTLREVSSTLELAFCPWRCILGKLCAECDICEKCCQRCRTPLHSVALRCTPLHSVALRALRNIRGSGTQGLTAMAQLSGQQSTPPSTARMMTILWIGVTEVTE